MVKIKKEKFGKLIYDGLVRVIEAKYEFPKGERWNVGLLYYPTKTMAQKHASDWWKRLRTFEAFRTERTIFDILI